MAATSFNLDRRGPSLSVVVSRDSERITEASRDAMRNTAQRAKVLVSKQIRKYLALSKTLVDNSLNSYYNEQKDQAVVAISNKRFPITVFKYQQAFKRGRYKSTGAKRRGGFKVKIWKGQPQAHFKRAFHFKGNLAERKGNPRFPVRQFISPSLAGTFLWARGEIQDDIDAAFLKEFDRAVKRKARGY